MIRDLPLEEVETQLRWWAPEGDAQEKCSGSLGLLKNSLVDKLKNPQIASKYIEYLVRQQPKMMRELSVALQIIFHQQLVANRVGILPAQTPIRGPRRTNALSI